MLSRDYSGVVVNQDQSASNTVPVTQTWQYQEFQLPTDYVRGTDPDEQKVADLSGIQVCLSVSDVNAVQLDVQLQHLVLGSGWVVDATASVTGAHAEGNKVWVDLYFDQPIPVANVIAQNDQVRGRWRFGIRGGADGIWASIPNPLAAPHALKAYAADGTTALTSGGHEFSFMFRVLALTADAGIDFLGNNYRSAVSQQTPDLVHTGEGSSGDTFWLSKPNPSKFAVENLYFDLRQEEDGSASIIDSVVLDPITPGVYFSIYYTSEGDPTTNADDWDGKLWTRVPKVFQATKRDTFILPEPIVAKYVKIEFSHLQGQYYRSGDFAQPIKYKKHPKWVLDYFLVRFATDTAVSSSIEVIWDTLDLAYNYYLDDLKQEPAQPVNLTPANRDTVVSFLKQNNDVSDQIDQTTLSKISQAIRPYVQNPVLDASLDFLLSDIVQTQTANDRNASLYPAESLDVSTFGPSDVTNLRRERIVFEQSYPVMFFYVTCRHTYREIIAPLSHDRAYFVGIRQIAFTRERYTTAFDTPLYIGASSGQVDVDRNDFVNVNDQWVVYSQ